MSTEGLQEQTSILEYTATGPGLRLRSCRETSDWTIDDVARHLRIKAHIIESIENDDYSNPPQMVFLRGYLRAYSRLLNLPEDEIIASFNALQLQEEVKPVPILKRTPKKQPVSLSLIGGIAATSIVIVGLLIWLATPRSTTHAAKVSEAVTASKPETVQMDAAKVESAVPAVPTAPPVATTSILPAPLEASPIPSTSSKPAASTKDKHSDLTQPLSNAPQQLAQNHTGPVVDDLSDVDDSRIISENTRG